MSMNRGLYSSASDDWETPQWLFDELNKRYCFDLDVCATAENAKCKRFYTKEDNALIQAWNGRCWMNPPYGKAISDFCEKAFSEVADGNAELVVGLLPSRTDTRWFHSFVYGKAEITFLKGRLKFGGSKNSAPFPSLIAVWEGKK